MASRTTPKKPEPVGFTLGEAVAIHSSLLASKQQMEENHIEIVKENGRDVYDTIWRDCGTALEKVTKMAKDLIAAQGGTHGED